MKYNWLIIFRCTRKWFDIFIYYGIITLWRLVTIYHHTKLWQFYSLYSLCCALYPVTDFITGSLYFLIHFKYFTQPPAHPSSNHQMVLCIWVCFCLVFFVLALDFTYKWTHIFVFLCQWQNSIFLWVVQIYIYIRVLM